MGLVGPVSDLGQEGLELLAVMCVCLGDPDSDGRGACSLVVLQGQCLLPGEEREATKRHWSCSTGLCTLLRLGSESPVNWLPKRG